MTSSLPDTREARTRVLRALRSTAPTPSLPQPDLSVYLQGPYGVGTGTGRPPPRSLMAGFEQAARAWRADVLQVDADHWPQAVRAALDQRSCRRPVLGRALWPDARLQGALEGLQPRCFDQALEGWKSEFFAEADAGICQACAGLADTGTLVLWPGPDEPRTLSLVPPVNVVLLRVSTLYASLPAAMAALAPERGMPTNLVLVTGPSKTSDIQQTLAYGAHGPKELVIVLIDDLAQATLGASA